MNVCKAIIKSGARKGEECGKTFKTGERACKTHSKTKVVIEEEEPYEEDEVYILGDVAVGGTNGQIYEFLKRLNGKKYLILGNHDNRTIMKCAYLQACFEWIKYHEVFDYNGKTTNIIKITVKCK
jgi:calcineurin-like phosphoesterase family protein